MLISSMWSIINHSRLNLLTNPNWMSGLCSYYTHYFITRGCVLLCFVYWLKYSKAEYRTSLDNSCINLFKLAVKNSMVSSSERVMLLIMHYAEADCGLYWCIFWVLPTRLAHTKLPAGVALYFLNSTVLVLPLLFLWFLRLHILFEARNAMKRSVFLKKLVT